MEKGDRYKIRNRTMGGRRIVEGAATLQRQPPDLRNPRDPNEFWLVVFDDEPGQPYQRLVYPADKID